MRKKMGHKYGQDPIKVKQAAYLCRGRSNLLKGFAPSRMMKESFAQICMIVIFPRMRTRTIVSQQGIAGAMAVVGSWLA